MIGELLDGRYRVVAKLGQGGMGEVWLVEHEGLGRREALKIIHPAMAARPEFVTRFRREARAANRVRHPNIIGVHGFGQLADGRYFLALEYVDGEALDQRLRRAGPSSVSGAVNVLLQLADAVHAAHAEGVIHRDLKLENLLLTTERGRADVLKILDFGIAKIVAPDYQESVAALTREGEVFGTFATMAPELFGGAAAGDARSDLYAIGCIATELLTGRPPFAGAPAQLAVAHLMNVPEPLRARRPEVPAALEAIVARLLEKDPDARFPDGAALAAALTQLPLPRRRGATGGGVFVDESTVIGGAGADEGTERATAPEADPTLPHRIAALRALAEDLLGSGGDDLDLIVGLAELGEAEHALAGLDAEQASVAARTDAVALAGKRREGSLRFTLGELVYQRGQGRGGAEVDATVRDLEARLAAHLDDLERELGGLAGRGAALAVERDALDAVVAAHYDALERVVMAQIARAPAGAAALAWRERLAAARALRRHGSAA